MDRDVTERLVLEFYDLFVNQRDFDAAVRYLGDPYIQHRADVPSDTAGLRAFNDAMRRRHPRLHADVRRVFVDGDHVILHGHVVPEPGERGSAHVEATARSSCNVAATTTPAGRGTVMIPLARQPSVDAGCRQRG